MDRSTERLVAVSAIVFPILHSITDVMEWAQKDFSPAQLWLNFIAFLPVPAILLGLYAAQRPRISKWGLFGACRSTGDPAAGSQPNANRLDS